MTDSSLDTGASAAATPPPALGMEEQKHLRKAQASTNRLLWSILAVLCVLVGAVIFMLPKYVSEKRESAAAARKIDTPAVAAAPAAPAATPYEEAQRLKLREQAQQVLAPLLDAQAALEKKDVKRWATEAFDAAVATAHKGDDAYAAQRYEEAKGLYEQATAALKAIEDSQPALFTAQMKAGAAAFEQGDADAAEKAYTLASLIDPGSIEASTGAQRAHVLKDVLVLNSEARALENTGDLDTAREKYQKALALDRANGDANKAIARLNAAIVDRNFSAAMSRGFAALQAGNAAKAQEEFKQAQTIKPSAKEVATAMQQAQDQQTFSALSVHLAAARQKEADESWQDALSAWNAALAVDPNLVAAQEGQKRATSRLNLDTFFIGIIKDPLRLSDQGVFNQTSQVLTEAGKLSSPGPKLQEQMASVKKFLAQIRVPATVTLQSDGQTQVTLYKVGEQGLFTTKTLSLTPGTYVAVGVRKGFRDTRNEFTVTIDGQAPVVSVICKDAI